MEAVEGLSSPIVNIVEGVGGGSKFSKYSFGSKVAVEIFPSGLLILWQAATSSDAVIDIFKKSFVVSRTRILLGGDFKLESFKSISFRDPLEFVFKLFDNKAAFVMANWRRFTVVSLVPLPRFLVAKRRLSLTGQVLVGGGMPPKSIERISKISHFYWIHLRLTYWDTHPASPRMSSSTNKDRHDTDCLKINQYFQYWDQKVKLRKRKFILFV